MLKENKGFMKMLLFLLLAVSLCLPETTYAASGKVSVTMYGYDGKVFKKITVQKGQYVELPGMVNRKECTFMGWAREKGKTSAPRYEAGARIRLTSSIKLYPVEQVRSKEPDLTEKSLSERDSGHSMASPDLKKYRKVIFVGDSRTKQMRSTFRRQYGTVPKGVAFVAKGGKGLAWFQSDGYKQLLALVRDRKASDSRPAAVIFNLGVNDLQNANEYVAYMNSIAGTLEREGCRLFYMSVNPMNEQMHQPTTKSGVRIRAFNKTIINGLSGRYKYINTYRWLIKTGYVTGLEAAGKGRSADDGLHYSMKTYKRIYDHCIKVVNSSR